MSARTATEKSVANYAYPSREATVGKWTRNPSWPTIYPYPGGVVGLYAVWPDAGTADNFFAVQMYMSSGGSYNVNFGDGTFTTYYSGQVASHIYDYDSPALANTNKPVSLLASSTITTSSPHGYSDGAEVQFYNISGVTGLEEGRTYYVKVLSTIAFRVSATPGGALLVYSGSGSATLLPYKIATVGIYPASGSAIFTAYLNLKYSASYLSNYSSGWLDANINLPYGDFYLAGSNPIRYMEHITVSAIASGVTNWTSKFNNIRSLVSVEVTANLNSLTSTNNLFNSCPALQEVMLPDLPAVTDASYMFYGCSSLESVRVSAPSATNMYYMFYNCYNLKTVELVGGTSNVTNMAAMFLRCLSLETIPLLDTSSVTNMDSMFSNCTGLKTIPLLDTSSVTDMTRMFQACSSLKEVPPLDMSSVTTTSNMFVNCGSLDTSPPFTTTTALTNTTNMFRNCYSLRSVSQFDTSAVTNMSYMFYSCYTLASVPLFDTSAATTMSNMFYGSIALVQVPAFDTTAVTSSSGFNNMISNCYSLSRVQAKDFRFTFSVTGCKLSSSALNEIYTNLPTVTGQTITVTNNWGVTSDNPSIATAKGWTVSG